MTNTHKPLTKNATVPNSRDFGTAVAAYEAGHDASMALLDEIGKLLIAERYAAGDYKPDWGHVGSAISTAEQLAEIRDRLAGLGEYA